MTKNILLIPDIHNKFRRAENVIRDVGPDLTIFLGDYFDDFGDTPRQARETASWLKEALDKPRRIFCVGNHDAHYMNSLNHPVRCSGFSEMKAEAIGGILTPRDWDKFKLYHFENGALFSHAGLSNKALKDWSIRKESIELFLERSSKDAINAIWSGEDHWMLAAGICRGGFSRHGGITWNDFDDEFEPIPDLMQIFGHTPRIYPEWKEKSLCLDTHLRHYAVMVNDRITIHEIDKDF